MKSQLVALPVFLSAVLLCCGGSAADIKVDTDFPGGSGVAEIDQQRRHIRLNPTLHKDRGWTCWWYVKVSGLVPGETISLNVGDAPWATPDRAAVSVNNHDWTQTPPGRRNDRRIEYRHVVKSETCWFAWGPPFVPSNARELVDHTARSLPFATAFELCKTRAGRAVPALTIDQTEGAKDDRHGVWIQARQHAWESGSSWVCRGLVEWLVSDDPRATSLRKNAIVTIVPIMDIDNVAIGAGGKSQKPQDHNRDWSDTPRWNSVRAAMDRIAAMDKAKQFDLFVDLHNPGANDKQPFYFVPPRDILSDTGWKNLEHFLAVSRLEITGPLALSARARTSGAGYDKNWKKISKNWVALNTRDHVVAVTLETSWNTPNSNQTGYRTTGRQLGLAIERYLRTRDQ